MPVPPDVDTPSTKRFLPSSTWEEVKLAAIAGVPYTTLARNYGLYNQRGLPDTSAIRKRAQRERWPVVSRIRESARRKGEPLVSSQPALPVTGPATAAQLVASHLVTEGEKARFSSQKAAVTVTDDLVANGQRGTLLAQQLALRSIEQTIGDLLPIKSMGDAKTALQIVRIAAGMDSGEASRVTIGLFGGNLSQSDAVTEFTDVETTDDSPEK